MRRHSRRPPRRGSLSLRLPRIGLASLVSGAVVGAGALWWFWPWLAAPQGGSTEVITTFVEDPKRVETALRLWKARPDSLLVLQGNDEYQRITRKHLEDRGLWPRNDARIITLTAGCDTVQQLTLLARWMGSYRHRSPGLITVVTGSAHLPRAQAIAKIVFGADRWRVEGMEAPTGDNRPEASFRLQRDQLRAQLWRATGWDGRSEQRGACP